LVQYTHTEDVVTDCEKHVVSNDAKPGNFSQICDGKGAQRSGAYLKHRVFLVDVFLENTVS